MKKKEYQKPTQTVIPIKMCLLAGNSAPGPWKKRSVWFHYLIRLKNAHRRVLNKRW